MSTEARVTFLHKTEYRTKDMRGQWSEPVIRYLNETHDLSSALKRHQRCEDFESDFGHEFEGIYGYSYKNCELVTRTVTTITHEEPVS